MKAYCMGCSVNGCNGARNLQDYPTDFDGVRADQ